jgi:hypothetical protein
MKAENSRGIDIRKEKKWRKTGYKGKKAYVGPSICDLSPKFVLVG